MGRCPVIGTWDLGCAIFLNTVMSEEALTFDSVRAALLFAFPELLERIWNTFGLTGHLVSATQRLMSGSFVL
jgi:hypothetical protein